MKNIYWIVLIVVLISINVYQNYTILHLKNEIQQIENKDIDIVSDYLFLKNITDSIQITINNSTFDTSVYFETTNKKLIKFQKEIEKKPHLILTFSELGCSQCYEKDFTSFLEVVDIIGEQNIIFLGNYENYREFMLFIENSNLDEFNCINCNDDKFKIPKIDHPFMYVLDENFKIHDYYVIYKNNNAGTKSYIKNIKSKYNL